jgi:putative acetyltransferase
MITVREERPEDIADIHRMNREAFGQDAEADLVDRLRAQAKTTLSLVAEQDGRIVGHILFSPVMIEAAAGTVTLQGLAPMAVLPSHQKQGIGSRLVARALAILKAAGHRGIVVLGHPAYYPRFGFVPASTYGIRCAYDAPDEAFMALELTPGALKGCSGLAKFEPEFAEI